MYIANDSLFPPAWSELIGRVSQRTVDGSVITGSDGKIRFLDDTLEEDFMPTSAGIVGDIDYFKFLFGLDSNNPKDSKKIKQTPLYTTFEAAKRDSGGCATGESEPIVLTPNNRSYKVRTFVQEIGSTGQYLALELWSRMSRPDFWVEMLKRGELGILEFRTFAHK